MAVRIRMKRMGRRHRPFYRICATDSRTPRDGRVIEELGTYDPMVKDTDARTVLNSERIDYWLSVGAQPSDKVRVLIKKYGTDGTHVEKAEAARALLSQPKALEPLQPAPKPAPAPEPKAEASEEEAAPEAAAEEAPAEEAPAQEEASEE